MFEESCELYQYMSTIDEEKLGFKKLIDIKDRRLLNVQLNDYKEDRLLQVLDNNQARHNNTRKGGINRQETETPETRQHVIVVDSREFSSMTPIYLHDKDFWIIPMVLTVGDYVLSDDICIERKSVLTGDLFESFKSGRLLQQITNMVRFYKKPVLLIEFDSTIPFKLYETTASDSAMGGDLNPASIISKITLLTLHFPTLSIIWSKGPAHTAEIFKDIKKH